jgi:hypothetical protein
MRVIVISSVIIQIVDQDGVGAFKREGQTPISVHRHSPVAGQIVLERMPTSVIAAILADQLHVRIRSRQHVSDLESHIYGELSRTVSRS